MHYAYLIKLSENKYYIGQTTDLEKRMQRHLRGQVKSTSKYEAKNLVWYSAFLEKDMALAFEKYLKTASGKAFRNARLVRES